MADLEKKLDEIFQSAYEHLQSIETALVWVNNDILLALDNNQSVGLLFILDLSAAFDKKSLLCATSDATQTICSGYSASSVKNHPLLNHLVFLSVQVENGPEVTLLFKKDELYEKNYRPVTVLPILNNI